MKKKTDIKFPPKPHFANVTHLDHFISCAGDKSGFKIIHMKKKKREKKFINVPKQEIFNLKVKHRHCNSLVFTIAKLCKYYKNHNYESINSFPIHFCLHEDS